MIVAVNFGFARLYFALSLAVAVVSPLAFLHGFTAHIGRLHIAYTLTICDVFVRAET